MKKSNFLLFAFLFLTRTAFAQQDSTATAQRFPPLQVDSLGAAVVNKNVQLLWTVNNNEEARSFEVERAEGNSLFHKVGGKLSSNRTGKAEYEFVDALPKKNVSLLYRIRIVARDGADVYSAVQTVRIGDAALQCKLKQNPVRSSIEVEVVSAKEGPLAVTVVTAYGQKVIAETAKLSTGSNLLSFSSQSLQPGLHRLVLEATGERAILSFVKE